MKTLYGWGINDANYSVSPRNSSGKRKECPYYAKWRGMLARVYCVKYLKRFPSYGKVQICAEWRHFSVFKEWMEGQDWHGKHLDKDILSGKIYSPDTCLFVRSTVNYAVIGVRSRAGVHYNKEKGRFQAVCSMHYSKKKHLGYFDGDLAAYRAWRECKAKVLIKISKGERDRRVRLALLRLAAVLQGDDGL